MKKNAFLISLLVPLVSLEADWPSLELRKARADLPGVEEPASATIEVLAPEGVLAEGEGTYALGEMVTLLAPSQTEPGVQGYDSVNPHLIFEGWREGDEIVSSANPYSFEAAQSRNLEAAYSLAVQPRSGVWYVARQGEAMPLASMSWSVRAPDLWWGPMSFRYNPIAAGIDLLAANVVFEAYANGEDKSGSIPFRLGFTFENDSEGFLRRGDYYYRNGYGLMANAVYYNPSYAHYGDNVFGGRPISGRYRLEDGVFTREGSDSFLYSGGFLTSESRLVNLTCNAYEGHSVWVRVMFK